MTELEQFCASNNIDHFSVQCLLEFIVKSISENPSIYESFMTDPGSVILAGVKRWHQLTTEQYNELLINPVKQQELINSIYHQLKEM